MGVCGSHAAPPDTLQAWDELDAKPTAPDTPPHTHTKPHTKHNPHTSRYAVQPTTTTTSNDHPLTIDTTDGTMSPEPPDTATDTAGLYDKYRAMNKASKVNVITPVKHTSDVLHRPSIQVVSTPHKHDMDALGDELSDTHSAAGDEVLHTPIKTSHFNDSVPLPGQLNNVVDDADEFG